LACPLSSPIQSPIQSLAAEDAARDCIGDCIGDDTAHNEISVSPESSQLISNTISEIMWIHTLRFLAELQYVVVSYLNFQGNHVCSLYTFDNVLYKEFPKYLERFGSLRSQFVYKRLNSNQFSEHLAEIRCTIVQDWKYLIVWQLGQKHLWKNEFL
jgi:hypothetical protein